MADVSWTAGERQVEMLVSWAEMPRSPGHVFYDRLQAVLIAAGFERQCAKEYAPPRGRPSFLAVLATV